jgi:DNA-binding response OmpR family regulator
MTERILLIDDDPTLASEMEPAFAERGFTIDHAADAETATLLVEAFDYAAILLDIMLARRDELDLLHSLRDRAKSPPIVIVSAYLPDYLRDVLEAFPAVKLLVPKPIDPKALATVVAALVTAR